MTPKPSLTEFERNRIESLLAAAECNDWDAFKNLSDGEFINFESMKEQFNDSARKIIIPIGQWQQGATVTVMKDKTRVIWIRIEPSIPKDPPISLILHSTPGSSPSLAVWVFAEDFRS